VEATSGFVTVIAAHVALLESARVQQASRGLSQQRKASNREPAKGKGANAAPWPRPYDCMQLFLRGVHGCSVALAPQSRKAATPQQPGPAAARVERVVQELFAAFRTFKERFPVAGPAFKVRCAAFFLLFLSSFFLAAASPLFRASVLPITPFFLPSAAPLTRACFAMLLLLLLLCIIAFQRLRGSYYWALGRHSKALSKWAEAVELGTKLGTRFEVALAHYELGRHVDYRSSDARRSTHLAAASAHFGDIGATRLHRLALEELELNHVMRDTDNPMALSR
jgi:hypothetical protein